MPDRAPILAVSNGFARGHCGGSVAGTVGPETGAGRHSPPVHLQEGEGSPNFMARQGRLVCADRLPLGRTRVPGPGTFRLKGVVSRDRSARQARTAVVSGWSETLT